MTKYLKLLFGSYQSLTNLKTFSEKNTGFLLLQHRHVQQQTKYEIKIDITITVLVTTLLLSFTIKNEIGQCYVSRQLLDSLFLLQ